MTTWPSFGSGSGISRMTSTSGPPKPVLRIACMGCLHQLHVSGMNFQIHEQFSCPLSPRGAPPREECELGRDGYIKLRCLSPSNEPSPRPEFLLAGFREPSRFHL